MNRQRAGEWGAAMLILSGVIFVSEGTDPLWRFIVGCVLLTFGVRLAIDVAKAAR